MAPARLRTHQAHGARVYDYILGGKDNYDVDREVGDASLRAWPALSTHMREARTFMHRSARYLAAEKGMRQFLDIGTGIPTSPNLHEVVQEIAPETRVVYCDNDPIVLSHARALMKGSREGRTSYLEADMRDPEKILNSRELLETLDLTQPTALTVISVVHFILDEDEALRVVKRLVDVLPSGSWVALTIATDEFAPEALAKVAQNYADHGEPLKWRTKAEAERFFDGLELEEPGVVQMHKWRRDPAEIAHIADSDIAMYGAVARKP
ncbi:SAM-dependent methyltransferase [Streptomyces radicis]|uniref:SAM-dependent methyltransferase n=1 Tax=Streptomyces radicis TaxID=1750517 RepID=A0A3A9WAV8_9ACTN|nr:SAM-dependent methyltransferase [Streptomyces radicis]RKN04736.1 SAM-dependent methyltransferase [Streptomyces radicis]RKN15942.1 SAM-dependent methyltransferase [Streptomyces radicis]